MSPLHGCERSRARGPLQGWTESKLVPQRLCPRARPLPVTVWSGRPVPSREAGSPPSLPLADGVHVAGTALTLVCFSRALPPPGSASGHGDTGFECV